MPNKRIERDGGEQRSSSLVQWPPPLMLVVNNPVHAGIVEHHGKYRWSSYGGNGPGETSDLLRPYPVYLNFGWTGAERQASYRELFHHELQPGVVGQIRQASNGNFALGNPRCTEEIAVVLGRRVIPGRAGRPRQKTAADEDNTEKGR